MAVGSVLYAASPAVDPGQKMYDSKCASCHGKDGKGKPVMAKALKVEPVALDMTTPAIVEKKDEELLKVIADGKNKMPAYSKQLKPAEQKAVLQYLRGLAAKNEEKPQEGKGATK